jgi:hypothetical protein
MKEKLARFATKCTVLGVNAAGEIATLGQL